MNIDASYIADIVVSIIIACLFIAIIVFKIKKKFVWFLLSGELVLAILFGALKMNISMYVIIGLFVVSTFVTLFVNLSEIRGYFAINMQKATISSNKGLTKESRDKLVHDITLAVKWLSDTKTGALITFERNDSLNKYIDSGSIINCPVTPEIIETIFYEGTRLHDGAIVIRGDVIVAAAVFFTATTRNLVGKYGARHRAALGISESTDAITIIVSEETGRISISYGGNLESIKYDDFEKVLSSFMLGSNKSEIDKK